MSAENTEGLFQAGTGDNGKKAERSATASPPAAGQYSSQAVKQRAAVAGPAGSKKPVRYQRDSRKFTYGVVSRPAARFSVTKSDRMPVHEAAAALDALHTRFIPGASEETREGFNNGLFLAYSLNSGSNQQSDAAHFSVEVPGQGTRTVTLLQVCNVIGVRNWRRMGRAFADEIREVNRQILESYDPKEFESVERFEMLTQVAHVRKLSRHPDLAHDSSDCCTGLSPEERRAIENSKRFVLADKQNVVDGADAVDDMQARAAGFPDVRDH